MLLKSDVADHRVGEAETGEGLYAALPHLGRAGLTG